MIAHVSQPSFAHASHHSEVSSALSLEQPQAGTTSSPPVAVDIAEVYAAVQEQLGGGLAALSAPQTTSTCSPYGMVTRLVYTEHPCESHLKAHNVDGGKDRS